MPFTVIPVWIYHAFKCFNLRIDMPNDIHLPGKSFVVRLVFVA